MELKRSVLMAATFFILKIIHAECAKSETDKPVSVSFHTSHSVGDEGEQGPTLGQSEPIGEPETKEPQGPPEKVPEGPKDFVRLGSNKNSEANGPMKLMSKNSEPESSEKDHIAEESPPTECVSERAEPKEKPKYQFGLCGSPEVRSDGKIIMRL